MKVVIMFMTTDGVHALKWLREGFIDYNPCCDDSAGRVKSYINM